MATRLTMMRVRDSPLYRAMLVSHTLFVVVATVGVSWPVSMALRGRFRGGVVPNALVVVLVLLWLGAAYAWVLAAWAAGALPASGPRIQDVARAPAAPDPVARRVRFRARLAGLLMLAFFAVLLGSAAAAWLGSLATR